MTKNQHSALTVSNQPRLSPEWIRISKFCVNKGCKRVGVVAKRLSDFWVVLCDECRGKTIALDMHKIVAEAPDGFTPGKEALSSQHSVIS